MEINKIHNTDSLEFIKQLKDLDTDIIYSDPPYALGSEIIVRPDGKVDYKKATDFMNKWKMPDGYFWEEWFKESFRTLKYGGYCIMFGLDRQLLLFKYYAHLAGFIEHQSLYWYFISNFPKASDLSKNIDKHFGEERETVGKFKITGQALGVNKGLGKSSGEIDFKNEWNITIPTSPLAKKYDGYKYSIAPLKQTNETIMIFQKPYKTGSCLHDTLAYENGDKECCCGALDIEGGRVGIETADFNVMKAKEHKSKMGEKIDNNLNAMGKGITRIYETSISGRYPSQTFCNSETSEILDGQSGMTRNRIINNCGGDYSFTVGKTNGKRFQNQSEDVPSGCSKILHKCDFEKQEHNLYFYCPKVSKSERESGLNGFPKKAMTELNKICGEKSNFKTGSGNDRDIYIQNNHPTLKPISLNYRILKLFKTPNPQNIVYPFAGAGSEIIGGEKAGFGSWKACELDPDYINIADARIEFWREKFNKEQTKLAI